MKAFMRIADCGSLSEAARRHGAAKGSLSHQLRRLESELGAELFQRRGGRLAPTSAGIALLPHAREVIQACERAEDVVTAQRATTRSHLRIGTTDELGTNLMGPLAVEFGRDHPAVNIELLILGAASLFHPDSGIDCALYAGDPTDPAAANMVARRFSSYVSRLYAAPDYLAIRGHPATPEDLGRHALVVNRSRSGSTQWALSDGTRSVVFHADGRIASNDNWMTKLCVVQGQGIGYFPDFFVADEIRADALVPVLPGWTSDPSPLLVLHPAHRIANPLIKALTRFVGSRFDGYTSFPYRRSDRPDRMPLDRPGSGAPAA
nr:LysR family transcriptional regulator [Mesorhizobium sp. BR1-1-16]